MSNPTADYYNKKIGDTKIDVYRILTLYDVTHPAQQHAIKKLLRAGNSDETLKEDVEETIDCLERMLEMLDEDGFTEEDIGEPVIEITRDTERENYSDEEYEEAKEKKLQEMEEEIRDEFNKTFFSDVNDDLIKLKIEVIDEIKNLDTNEDHTEALIKYFNTLGIEYVIDAASTRDPEKIAKYISGCVFTPDPTINK